LQHQFHVANKILFSDLLFATPISCCEQNLIF
jgi:hypothetical protein